MNANLEFTELTSLIGEPVRASILWILLDGIALTATELAMRSSTSPSGASMHLNKLVQANLLAVESQGRHRYYKLANPEVAFAVEALANLIPAKNAKQATPAKTRFLNDPKYCRTCYDHLAGTIGVAVTEQFVKRKIITPREKEYEITKKGIKFFMDFDIDVIELQEKRRFFAKACLDWSERKHHLSGALGAEFLTRLIELDWLRKIPESRAVSVTSSGKKGLWKILKFDLEKFHI